MNHHERRRVLHDAVEHLEPAAHSAAIRGYVRHRHGVDVPLLRIYVDLERLVASGDLSRTSKSVPTGDGTTFFWETTNKSLVETDHPSPKMSAATAPLAYHAQYQTDADAKLRNASPALAVSR